MEWLTYALLPLAFLGWLLLTWVESRRQMRREMEIAARQRIERTRWRQFRRRP